MKLEEWFQKYCRNRGMVLAEKLLARVRKKLSKRAPVKITRGGNLVARTPALPGAPPRYVTGRLYKSVTLRRTARGAVLTIAAPYASFLEVSDHKFLAPAKKELGIA